MPRDRIVFWQEVPSPHQAPFVRELADRLQNGRTIAVFEDYPSEERLSMGWAAVDYGAARVLVSPKADEVSRLLDHEPGRSVHIFSSVMRNDWLRRIFFAVSKRRDVIVGLLSEARDWRGWKGFARLCHSVLHERRYRDRVDFVLAIGHLGQEWFISKCSYPPEKVFPWCYVCESPPADIDCEPAEAGGCGDKMGTTAGIVFVGGLIDRKAVDVRKRGFDPTLFRSAALG